MITRPFDAGRVLVSQLAEAFVGVLGRWIRFHATVARNLRRTVTDGRWQWRSAPSWSADPWSSSQAALTSQQRPWSRATRRGSGALDGDGPRVSDVHQSRSRSMSP